MKNDQILSWLAGRTERDAERGRALEKKFREAVAPTFLPVSEDMDAHRHMEYWLKGGRGSCKSSFASLKCFDALEKDPKGSALILRKVKDTLRDSVYAQILWARDRLGLNDEWIESVSPMALTNARTGQQIIFRGLDESRKLKSIRPKRGYFAFVWFEEADELAGYDKDMHSIIESTGRGKGARTVFCVTYNPPKSANNWVNKEVLTPKDSRMVHQSSYLDVPREWLGEVFLKEAEDTRARDELKWRHVYGGEATGDGGNVFRNLTIRPIGQAERLLMPPSLGLDFGYANDPSALMRVYFRTGDRTLFVLDEWDRQGAGFTELEKACRAASREAQAFGVSPRIWSDTEPRTIAELKGRGVEIAAARKGKKSRSFGIEWLQDLKEIVIDGERCPNAAREFSAFEYARGVNGEWRGEYQDGDDHTIDATRYALWEVIHKSKRKKNYSGKGARK